MSWKKQYHYLSLWYGKHNTIFECTISTKHCDEWNIPKVHGRVFYSSWYARPICRVSRQIKKTPLKKYIAWYETDKHKYVFIQTFFASEASQPTPLTCFLKKHFCQHLLWGIRINHHPQVGRQHFHYQNMSKLFLILICFW